ncbi:hypothetical protein EUTSA_v10003235mg [Eutrema salsugineum]|uniref:Uncharacterized protein n=1 Tax=Eutrema salsugineum TaxID=72664 RepID=V4LXM6_EUTSA|nr:salicylate/benzoate carboxyl methyltransferase [Eutrema salsugineum]ESQ44653.1 hypothetical protein EUTSA_v10003235mg [Eutrema salsugineum]
MSSSRDSFLNALSMNGGEGEHSYSNNSRHQRDVISKTRPIVEENIREMLLKLNFPKHCIKVTDLGCSSGQNTFLVMSEIINTITKSYQQINQSIPEIDYCLNDLPENDFNTTFKLVSSLNKEVKGNCFISGVPGSFYSRLLPKKSLHFLHSSYSIHWLSKVPQGLEDNKKNVYISSGCSLNVCQSYMEQFQNDFYLFLRMRSEEMLPNGRMVLTFIGKKDVDPLCRDGFYLWSLLSDALVDLVLEEVVKESEVDSFNLPFYQPNEEEVREVVRKEGSFEIKKIETHELLVSNKTGEDEDDDYDDQSHGIKIGKNMANITRAITEPMLVAHFGDTIIVDCLFKKFVHHATQNYASFPRQTTFNIIISLIRK